MRLLRLPTVLLVAVLLAAACTSDQEPEAFRPPPAAPLEDGPCALVAEDVVVLGRTAFELRGVSAPDAASSAAIESAQVRIAAVAETAEPAVKPALDRLVLTAGLVRIQVATKLLRDEVLENMDVAYDSAVRACSGEAAATPPKG